MALIFCVTSFYASFLIDLSSSIMFLVQLLSPIFPMILAQRHAVVPLHQAQCGIGKIKLSWFIFLSIKSLFGEGSLKKGESIHLTVEVRADSKWSFFFPSLVLICFCVYSFSVLFIFYITFRHNHLSENQEVWFFSKDKKVDVWKKVFNYVLILEIKNFIYTNEILKQNN